MPLLLVLALSAGAVATPPAPARPICLTSRIEQAEARQAPRIARLGEMPPAKHIAAVLRTVDGCQKPLVISDEVGIVR